MDSHKLIDQIVVLIQEGDTHTALEAATLFFEKRRESQYDQVLRLREEWNNKAQTETTGIAEQMYIQGRINQSLLHILQEYQRHTFSFVIHAGSLEEYLNQHHTEARSLIGGEESNIYIDQKIEITHDILAQKIYALIDAEDKMRLKILDLIRDRANYYHEMGELLSRRELAYIDSYQGKLELTEEQAFFLEKSRRDSRRRRNRRMMQLSGVAVVILGFIIVAFFQWKKRIEGEVKARERVLAEQQKMMQLEQEALHAQEKERVALEEAIAATRNIVEVVMDQARRDIFELDYEAASNKYQDAFQLVQKYPEFQKFEKLTGDLSKGMMEVAYFYGEVGKIEEAMSIVEMLQGLARDSVSSIKLLHARIAQSHFRTSLEEALKTMDRRFYNTLVARYYPDMQPVRGGNFRMKMIDETSMMSVEVKSFDMAATEVSIWQYHLYCEDSGRDSVYRIAQTIPWEISGDNPMVLVSWFEAARYCNWLSGKHQLRPVYHFLEAEVVAVREQANGYRLPTEKEWEYVAKGGEYKRNNRYSGGEVPGNVAWYEANSRLRTHPVGRFPPNVLNLYDLSGNVWEWCQDFFPDQGRYALRGGSWSNRNDFIETTSRLKYIPRTHLDNVGFRCVRSHRNV